ncbi:MAG: ATPase, partial [Deltaproteobacteria bacterium]|nr:ATPase [Deltaproteobacteria bacterium]MBW2530339.1 ATPase [Deltaproteobacteria bacterium]
MSSALNSAERKGPSVLEELRSAVAEALEGKPEVIELGLTAMLAGGHLLIEDVPGVGKTTLA